MSKKYHKAPLPFLGQKRNFIKLIRQLDFSGKTVVDLFGGSGIIAHNIKQQNPTARVIYNDFDNYQGRLDQIELTEKLRQQIFEYLKLLDIPHNAAIAGKTERQQIASMIIKSGSTDWLTISSWLFFGGNYAHTYDQLVNSRRWYSKTPGVSLSKDNYLMDAERVRCDFRELLYKYENLNNVIFIADPPYIMTNQTGYSAKNSQYFKLKDAIDLIRVLYKKPTLYFSSPKSESEALFEVWQPDSMSKMQLTTGVGDGKKVVDYLFC